MRLLLIEDDARMSDMLATALTRQHYIVDVAHDAQEALGYLDILPYDLLVLDIVLPDINGITLCRQLRNQGLKQPILLLTAKDSSEDKVQGLDAGADDYLIKPFDFPELLARLRALTRRLSNPILAELQWGDLSFVPGMGEVTHQGNTLKLTPTEYNLLELLLRNPRKIFGYDNLIDHIWPLEPIPSENTIRSHIRRLRRKLKDQGLTVDPIETVHGLGYRLNENPPERTYFPIAEDDILSGSLSGPPSGPLTQLTLREEQTNPLLAWSQDRNAADQALTLQLYQLWLKYQDSVMADVRRLTAIAQALTPTEHQNQAAQGHHIAHKLAGLLGSLRIPEVVPLARQLEDLFQSAMQVAPAEAFLEQLSAIITSLTAKLQAYTASMTTSAIAPTETLTETPTREASPQPSQPTHSVLLISADSTLTEALSAAATTQPINFRVVASLEAGQKRLDQGDIVLVVIDLSVSPVTETCLQWLEQLRHRSPALPTLVLSDSGDLNERLQVMRSEAIAILQRPFSPTQLLTVIQQTLGTTSAPAKLLIVDDNRFYLEVIQSVLPASDYEVETLAEPTRFWQTLESFVPDLLILDINMPELNGIDLCRIVRNDPRWQELPILFVTSQAQDVENLQRCFSVGADDFITKSAMASELPPRLLSHLNRVRRWRNRLT